VVRLLHRTGTRRLVHPGESQQLGFKGVQNVAEHLLRLGYNTFLGIGFRKVFFSKKNILKFEHNIFENKMFDSDLIDDVLFDVLEYVLVCDGKGEGLVEQQNAFRVPKKYFSIDRVIIIINYLLPVWS
jgi:hypothetical protein